MECTTSRNRKRKDWSKEGIQHPPVSDGNWINDLLEYHGEVVAEIDSTHTSIKLSSCKEATAVTLCDHIMEYTALVASLQAKQAARNSVSSNACNSEIRIYWFLSEAIN